MAVRRRGNKLVIDYYPEGRKGPRKWRTLDPRIQDEDEARKIEVELKKSLKEPEEVEIESSMTVREAFPGYLDWYELHRAQRSWKDITYIYNRHIERILGDTALKDLNKHHINLYKRMRIAEKVIRVKKDKKIEVVRDISNRTINKELSLFSGFLGWCKKEYGIAIRPLDIESLPYKRPVPIPLTFDECMGILEMA
jgi:hypothetical protein